MWTGEQLLFMVNQKLFLKPPHKHDYFHITSKIVESAGNSLCSPAKCNVLVYPLSLILLNSTPSYSNLRIWKLLSNLQEDKWGASGDLQESQSGTFYKDM